jgi:hypothetical protein
VAELLIVKPRTLNAADKASLRKAGVIVVEAANPDEVRFIRAEQELAAGDLVMAAMRALHVARDTTANQLFVRLVSEAVDRRHAIIKDTP